MYALFLFTTHGIIDGSGLTDDGNAGDPTIHGCTLTKSWVGDLRTSCGTALDKPETAIVTIFIYCFPPGQ